MSITYNDLISRAEQVRDESEIGANTATRVGQLLADIIQWCQDNNADLGDYLLNLTAHLNESGGILNWFQSRIVLLKTMGGAYDDVSVGSLSDGDVYYDSQGNWILEKQGSATINGIHPSKGVFYVNLANKTAYQWDGTTFQVAIESGGGGGASTVTAFEGYEVIESVADLPEQGDPVTGYIVGTHIYAYVGEDGDTADGKYQDMGALEAAGVSVTTAEDGTFTIHAGGNDYTVNLNHTHENMAKLIVCEESDLPSTLDNSTIYAITDSGETEIEKLIIRGMEFAGGGTPSTDPRIVSPIGTQIDFNGESTKTVTVRATNLSEALTIAVTGVTANLQTISASDAEAGVQLTLTQGQDFESGTLRIYSSEVDKSWSVIDSQMYQSLAAVKFTKQQYLNTDICVGPNTRLEIDMKFDGADTTPNSTTTGYTVASSPYDQTYNPQKVFIVNSGVVNQSALIIFSDTSAQHGIVDNIGSITTRSTLVVDMVNSIVSFGGATSSIPAKTTTMPSGLKFAANPSGEKIFGRFDIILYSLKHYENNVLTHNYVPRIKNAVAGLYDTVNDVFISSETETELVAIS